MIELNLLEIEFLKWVEYRVIPRDFNYDHSANQEKYGIGSAENILRLYYERMISMVGLKHTSLLGTHDDISFELLTDLANSSDEYSSCDEFDDAVNSTDTTRPRYAQ